MGRVLKYGLGLVFLGVVAVGVASVTPSSQNPSAQVAVAPPTHCPAAAATGLPTAVARQFAVKFVATAQGDLRKPIIVGRTNLPVGTELLVTLERKASDYDAESKIAVGSDGCFTSEQFTQNGGPINRGDYVIDVLMPVTAVQPQSVRNIIGEEGENITGPLVRRFHHLGKTAEYRVGLTAGSADTQRDADARQAAADDEDKRFANLRSEASLLAAKTLKANLRNPASADWISVYTNKDGSSVCIVLRSQNGFGGMNVERYAVVDQRFSEEASVWNKNCAGNGFYDYTGTVKLVE